ncbi:MAG: 2'-5' RNA ligase family protein [Candidatus Nitrosotenuis sp.]
MPNGGPSDPFYRKEMEKWWAHQNYLIEFRFSGSAKRAIRELKNNISKNFRVSKKKIVPHITLVGPIRIMDEEILIDEVVDICKKYELVKFKLDGFDNFENRVIYVRINPSEELKKLRLELATRLGEISELSEFDNKSRFTFHATLVMNDIQKKFDQIWKYLQTWEVPKTEQYVVRITILTPKRRILAEYDLLQRKLLNRREALDRKKFHKTIEKLDKRRRPSEIEFTDVASKGKIYVFSDAHFDHSNIIRYCHRPFDSTRQMNHELLEGWNHTVKENEIIYYLGDMTFGRHRHPTDYWLGKLNGEIFYVRGNHDSDAITRATIISTGYGIKYENYKFLLMHNPHRPFGYDGWIIHGDKHNNDMKNYPFINQKAKTVNVCAELVNYTPLSLDKLIPLIETGRTYETING